MNGEIVFAQSSVLKNSDLATIILSFIDPSALVGNTWDIAPSTSKQLLSVALTCTYLSGPALTLLWKAMDSLLPLFKILPSFGKVSAGVTQSSYTINSTIYSEGRDKFNEYAKKIKYLHIRDPQALISGHTLFRLQSLNGPTTILFPALAGLYVHMPTGHIQTLEYFNSLFLVANSPNLSIVIFDEITASTENFVASFLAVVSDKPSSIVNLHLKGDLTTNTSLSLLGNSTGLRHLNISVQNTVIDSTTFRNWGRTLVSLESLTIDLGRSTFVDTVDTQHDSSATLSEFLALRCLDLSGSATTMAIILGIIRTRVGSLTTIRLFSSWESRMEDVVACIGECSRVSPSSLLHIILQHRAKTALPPGCLLPLKDCNQLETLKLTNATIALKDEDIQDLCEDASWKNLRVFHVPPSPGNNAPSPLSLHALAKHCPVLRSLQISVDFRLLSYEDLQNIPDATPAGNLKNLTILNVERSGGPRFSLDPSPSVTVMQAIGVAQFLHSHIPPSTTVTYVPVGSEVEWWKGVCTILPLYRELKGQGASGASTNSV